MKREISGLVLVVALSARCGGSSPAAPTASTETKTTTTTTTTTPTTPTGNTSTFRMYTATSASGPWTQSTATVTGHDALGLVDPSPILMPDGSILLYYLMSYMTGGDPAASQPNNQWKMGVAKSSDNGLTFAHQGVAFTFGSSTTDPFPLMLESGLIRMLVSQGASVPSVTARDTTGLTFATAQDSGFRVTTGGVPGALKIGSTYYIYGCGSGGIQYFTSSDGMSFSSGTSTGLTSSGTLCDPSPIDAGGGTYLMAFKRGTTGGPSTDFTYIASSTNGRTWTDLGLIGQGSVPGLVKDRTGTLRIYVPGS